MLQEPVLAIRKTRFSLRFKLTVGLVLIMGCLFAGVNLLNVWTHRERIREESYSTFQTMSGVLAFALVSQTTTAQSLRSGSTVTLIKTTVSAAMKTNRDLAFGVVIDNDGTVVTGRARPELTRFPGNRRFADENKVLAEVARLDAKLGGGMMSYRFPLVLPNRQPLGKFVVGVSMERLEKEFQKDFILNISVLVATLLLLVAYALFALGRLVLGPIHQVMDAMRQVHRGNLDTRVELSSSDEIGVLADTYNFMVRGLREREQLKDAFSRYVSTKVYERINLGQITLTGEARNATVLFSDIRSFTSISEKMPPADVVRMLNDYFNVMVEIVFKYDGFLNKFIGDALMAVYNVPIEQSTPEMRAVNTALEMIHELDRFNKEQAARGGVQLKIGIGINTGPVIAGNIGHMKRLEYTVIGDTVNLAQRVESQTKVTGMPVLISETTYRAVAAQITAHPLPPVKIKGKQELVQLYAVTGLKGEPEIVSGLTASSVVRQVSGSGSGSGTGTGTGTEG
jgi:adenylate cyclase